MNKISFKCHFNVVLIRFIEVLNENKPPVESINRSIIHFLATFSILWLQMAMEVTFLIIFCRIFCRHFHFLSSLYEIVSQLCAQKRPEKNFCKEIWKKVDFNCPGGLGSVLKDLSHLSWKMAENSWPNFKSNFNY